MTEVEDVAGAPGGAPEYVVHPLPQLLAGREERYWIEVTLHRGFGSHP